MPSLPSVLSSFASSFVFSGFTSPLSRKGVPSWPMETKQPASALCIVVKTDESGEFLLHLVQPVVDGLLLFQQAIRLRVLKGLLDVAQFGVQAAT